MLSPRSCIFSLIVFLTCASIAGAQTDSIGSYYPLATGNVWQYQSFYMIRLMGSTMRYDSHHYVVTVSGDTLLGNGLKYHIVLASDGSLAHPRFQRMDTVTRQVFAFDTSGGGREIQIDSLLAGRMNHFGGNRWSVLPATFLFRIDTGEYFGRRLIGRYYGTPSGGPENTPIMSYTLTQGFGLTSIMLGYNGSDQFMGNSTEDHLVYAKIDGHEYGAFVSVERPTGQPARFELGQNYPNPFNPSTVINYKVGSRSKISLRVFNVLGKEVATLADTYQEAGSYSVHFSGDGLAGGVYFYRLQAGSFQETKRLLLLK